MEKNVSVFLADGFEEIEGLTVVDLLRRAGIHVTTVSIMERLTIHGAHQIDVQADKLFGEVDYTKEDKVSPYVYITSATIIGDKLNWENTGYAFRLSFDQAKYTEEDVSSFTLKIQEYYQSINAPNYMECHVVPNNKTEILFIVKPIKVV